MAQTTMHLEIFFSLSSLIFNGLLIVGFLLCHVLVRSYNKRGKIATGVQQIEDFSGISRPCSTNSSKSGGSMV